MCYCTFLFISLVPIFQRICTITLHKTGFWLSCGLPSDALDSPRNRGQGAASAEEHQPVFLPLATLCSRKDISAHTKANNHVPIFILH